MPGRKTGACVEYPILTNQNNSRVKKELSESITKPLIAAGLSGDS
jgi:hypothetical protein